MWKPLCIMAQLFSQKHYSGLSHRLFRALLSYSGLHWLGLLRLNWSAQKSKRYDRLNQAKDITKAAWLDVFTPWRFLSQHLSLAWRSQLLLKLWGVSFWPGLEASTYFFFLFLSFLPNWYAHTFQCRCTCTQSQEKHTIMMKVTGPIKLQMKWLSSLSQHLNRGTDQTY